MSVFERGAPIARGSQQSTSNHSSQCNRPVAGLDRRQASAQPTPPSETSWAHSKSVFFFSGWGGVCALEIVYIACLKRPGKRMRLRISSGSVPDCAWARAGCKEGEKGGKYLH